MRRVDVRNVDIISGVPVDWLVVGWFTPDYFELASKFSDQLHAHGAPHHLFAREKGGKGWSTQAKPAVVLEAMDRYPTKTLVLMDVDCVVRGDIAPVTDLGEADVGTIVIARNMRKGRRTAHWIAVESSSRVVVFNHTHGARDFVEAWKRQIDRSTFNHDEHSMVWAFLSCPDVRFTYVDQKYSAREVGQVEGAIIEHDSAHDEARRAARGRVQGLLRGLEKRLFRTGRTRRSRLKGELSTLLQAQG